MIHPIDQLKLIQPEKKDDSAAQLISMGVLFAGLYLLFRKPEQAVGESVLAGNPRATTARKLISDEDKQVVKELYEEGYSSKDIAEMMQVSGSTITNILRETGAEIRGNRIPRAIPDDQVEEVIRLYEQGLNADQIADKFGVDAGAVQRRLLEQDIQLRGNVLNLSNEEIKTLYLQGLTTHEIADKFNTDDETIRYRLIKMGVPRRSPEKDLPNEEIKNLYLQKLSAIKIAEKFNVSPQAILRRLRKMGVEPRAAGGAKMDLPDEEIKNLYLQGLSIRKIADKFNVSYGSIQRCLEEMGVERRASAKRKSEAGNPTWSDKTSEEAETLPAILYHGSKQPLESFEKGILTARAKFLMDETKRKQAAATGFLSKNFLLSNKFDIKSQGVFLALSPETASNFGKFVHEVQVNKPKLFIRMQDMRAGVDLIDHEKEKQLAEMLLTISKDSPDGRVISTYTKDIYVPKTFSPDSREDDNWSWVYEVVKGGGLTWDVLDEPAFVSKMESFGYDGTMVYEPYGAIEGRSVFISNLTKLKVLSSKQSQKGA